MATHAATLDNISEECIQRSAYKEVCGNNVCRGHASVTGTAAAFASAIAVSDLDFRMSAAVITY